MPSNRFPDSPKVVLQSLFNAAIEAAQPAKCLPRHLPEPPKGKTVVIGFGKGAAAMAKVVEDNWQGPLEGVVVTRYGFGAPCQRVQVLEAGHPVPDQAGIDATRKILEAVSNLSADDLVICLVSGGGSSLLVQPPEGITLEEKQALTNMLLASGAPIGKINTVRRHLSRVKGGRLAEACWPARVVSLIISDVPGDDLTGIASGPTVPDTTSNNDALAVLSRYGITPPHAIAAYLSKKEAAPPSSTAPCFTNAETILIATAMTALRSAATLAEVKGYSETILGDAIEGEARDVAREQARMALKIAQENTDHPRPCLLISGGETTVTIKGKGRGGPNTEFALALAIALNGHPGIYAIACDTDGIDGSENNAGAFIAPDTLKRAKNLGLDAQNYLDNNDSYSFFEKLNDLIVTGPTQTNVNDFRAILIV